MVYGHLNPQDYEASSFCKSTWLFGIRPGRISEVRTVPPETLLCINLEVGASSDSILSIQPSHNYTIRKPKTLIILISPYIRPERYSQKVAA